MVVLRLRLPLPPVDAKRPHAGWRWTAAALRLLLPLPPVDAKRPHAGWRSIMKGQLEPLPLRLPLPPVVAKRPHAGREPWAPALPQSLLPKRGGDLAPVVLPR